MPLWFWIYWRTLRFLLRGGRGRLARDLEIDGARYWVIRCARCRWSSAAHPLEDCRP